jgi:erythromycin esterase-like protein
MSPARYSWAPPPVSATPPVGSQGSVCPLEWWSLASLAQGALETGRIPRRHLQPAPFDYVLPYVGPDARIAVENLATAAGQLTIGVRLAGDSKTALATLDLPPGVLRSVTSAQLGITRPGVLFFWIYGVDSHNVFIQESHANGRARGGSQAIAWEKLPTGIVFVLGTISTGPQGLIITTTEKAGQTLIEALGENGQPITNPAGEPVRLSVRQGTNDVTIISDIWSIIGVPPVANAQFRITPIEFSITAALVTDAASGDYEVVLALPKNAAHTDNIIPAVRIDQAVSEEHVLGGVTTTTLTEKLLPQEIFVKATIPPNTHTSWSEAVGEKFSIGTSGYDGRILASSDHTVSIVGRVVRSTSEGTLGGFAPTWTGKTLLGGTTTAAVIDLDETQDTHTAIVIDNPTTKTLTVTVAGYDSQGQHLGSFDVGIAERGSTFIGKIFPRRFASPTMAGGRLEFTSQTINIHEYAATAVITTSAGDIEFRPARAKAPVQPQGPPQVVWLYHAAKPFDTVDPAAADDDLRMIDTLVGDARLVGLGEATHGTSEFFRMKHRLLRYLVEHHGFTAFGIEADMASCLALDHYVLTGQGDPRTLVSGMLFWTWSNEEVLDMVQWIRAYNADPAHEKKVRYFGFDMQSGVTEMNRVLAYLHPIDPEGEALLASWYLPLRPFLSPTYKSYTSAAQTVRDQCHEGVAKAYQWMLDHRSQYVAATSNDAYELNVRLARVVVQNEEMLAGDLTAWGYANVRDKSMAENALWFLGRMGASDKVVLWAHNGHINKGGLHPAWRTMGEWLRDSLDDAYLTMGFAFNEGSAYAIRCCDAAGKYQGLQVNVIPPADPDSYEAVFVQAGFDRAILDMRTLDTSLPGAAWFEGTHLFREIGAVWINRPDFGLEYTVLPERFDALIFIRDTTASHYYWANNSSKSSVPGPTMLTMSPHREVATFPLRWDVNVLR